MDALRNYYTILDQIKDSLVIKEYRPDGNGSFVGGEIKCASRIKAEHYNLTMRTILGKTDFDLMPIEQAQKALEDDLWVMRNNKSLENIEEIVTYPNGKTVSKLTTKSPMSYTAHGAEGVCGVICISRCMDICSDE